MKLPTRFQLIGQVGLSEYKKWIMWFQDTQSQITMTTQPITCRAYARFMSVCLYLCVYLYVSLSVCLSVCLTVICLCVFLCIVVCLYILYNVV